MEKKFTPLTIALGAALYLLLRAQVVKYTGLQV